MFLYLTIIFISVVIICTVNILFTLPFYGFSALYVILGTVFAVIFAIAIGSIFAFFIRWIPQSKINPFSKYFKEHKCEKKLYNFLKVRNWKDKIPELGKALKYFDKSKIEKNPTPEYLLSFLKETCYAEIMHIIAGPSAFFLMLIYPIKYFVPIVLPVIIVNIFLHTLPVFVQRYTRPKLAIAYRRVLKYQKTETVEVSKDADEKKENDVTTES